METARRAAGRLVFRRPDAWVGLFTLALVATIYRTTRLTLYGPERIVLSHLADSFGAGIFSAAGIVFISLLLRATPVSCRRALGIAWSAVVALSTLGLVLSFAPPSRTSASWVLQALVLSVLAWGCLLAVLLPSTGLARWRDLGAAAYELGRNWIVIFIYLILGGSLLAAVRVFSPEVVDPVLLRMDLSLGGHPVEAVAEWAAARPWVGFVSRQTYPLLGVFVAGIAACLHLAGATAGLRRVLIALLLVGLVGPVCYWCAPAIGPIYAYPELVAKSGQYVHDAARRDAVRQAIVDGPDRVVMRPEIERNVVPSLHTAFTLVALAAAWSHRRRLFWAWLPLGFCLIATTLTLSVHYTVDLIAAVPLAVLCWSLADAAVRRHPPTGAIPLPALTVSGATLQRRALALGVSLAVALASLVVWAVSAPLSPWLAWPLTIMIIGGPAWCALRLHRQVAPGWTTTSKPAPTIAGEAAVARPARLLACAVFCSGGAALVLEQISEKYLATLIGASRPAATIVLAVYFAGLASGAWLCPKGTAGATRRLAMLELFIAGWAALLALAFFAGNEALGDWLATAGTDVARLGLMRSAIATLWLLPPTLAMGAQLPTLSAVLAGHAVLRGQSLPRFYALNLAGACAFTIGAPPLLFNPVGANGALWFVSGLGVLVGVMLWAGLPKTTDAPPPATAPTEAPVARYVPPRHPRLLAFVAGFVFFALEVVWFHLISAVCGASTYSFSILLAAVLLGLALGSAWIARDKSASLSSALAWSVAALAAGNALWPWAGRIMASVREALDLRWFWAGEALKFTVISVLVLPTAIGLGKVFPLVLKAAGDDPRLVGRLGALNVVGCVAGALVAGFALIPYLGAEHTLLGLALLVAAGWLSLRRRIDARRLAPGLIGLALLIILPRWDRLELTRGFGVYLAPSMPGGTSLEWFREDFRAGFVTVTSTPTTTREAPVKTLRQNGKFDADDAGEMPAQISFGLLAALHAPARDRALVVGCGSGQTASVVARLGFRQVDIAELSPAHLAAARAEFGHINAGVLDRPNVNVHVEDGRNVLLRSRDRYDVIQIELTSIWFAGATDLYSREFYALARRRLAPGGALVQWIQLHHITPREIATILATARSEFPDVAVWRAGHQACLVATDRPPQLNRDVWRQWLTDSGFTDERRLTGLLTPTELGATELLPAARLDAMLARHGGAVGINTDRNRWLEFQTPKYYLNHYDLRTSNLDWLQRQ